MKQINSEKTIRGFKGLKHISDSYLPEGYSDAPGIEIVRETERAILVDFMIGERENTIQKWLPKSVCAVWTSGAFVTLIVKRWFIGKSNLWNVFNFKVRGY